MKHPWRHPRFATDPKLEGDSDAEQESDTKEDLSLDETEGDAAAARILADPNRGPNPEPDPDDDPP